MRKWCIQTICNEIVKCVIWSKYYSFTVADRWKIVCCGSLFSCSCTRIRGGGLRSWFLHLDIVFVVRLGYISLFNPTLAIFSITNRYSYTVVLYSMMLFITLSILEYFLLAVIKNSIHLIYNSIVPCQYGNTSMTWEHCVAL